MQKRIILITGLGRSGTHILCNWVSKNLLSSNIITLQFSLELSSFNLIIRNEIFSLNINTHPKLVSNYCVYDIFREIGYEINYYYLVREYRNWLASMLLMLDSLDLLDRIKRRMRSYGGLIRQYIEVGEMDNLILYDKFIIDSDYRRGLSEKMKLDSCNDDCLSTYASAQKSNFSGEKTGDTISCVEDRLNRYEMLPPKLLELYNKLLEESSEQLELSNKLFNS